MKKLYDVIYCDPPWEYDNKNTGGGKGKKFGTSGASRKYKTLSIEKLIQLNIPAKKDCCLFLWVSNPFLEDGLKVLNSWGFKYKTTIVWDKIQMGMGFWYRGQTEFLLLGIKGKIKPFRAQIRNIHSERFTKHSRKPGHFRKMIEILGFKNKLEMFARRGRTEGWDLFGFEAEDSIKI